MTKREVGLTFPGREGVGFTGKPSLCQVKGQLKCPAGFMPLLVLEIKEWTFRLKGIKKWSNCVIN